MHQLRQITNLAGCLHIAGVMRLDDRYESIAEAKWPFCRFAVPGHARTWARQPT